MANKPAVRSYVLSLLPMLNDANDMMQEVAVDFSAHRNGAARASC